MNIIDYRNKNKGFLTLYELQLVEGISKEEIFLALPFLKVKQIEKNNNPLSWKDLLKRSKQSIILRWQRVIEPQAAYFPNKNNEIKYLGNPNRIYARYKLQISKYIDAGITADKDAGEPFFNAPNQQGFDFYSGFIQIKNKGLLKKLVIGDYSLQFGQGIALWNGFGMGKSSAVTNIAKYGKGINKYSSTDENNFFRGLASTMKYKNLEFSFFASSKDIDGNIDTDTLQTEEDRINTLYNTGLHATLKDFEKKHSINQKLYGGNLEFNYRRIKIGFTAVHYQFSQKLQASHQLYKRYHFSGSQNSNVSFHYRWNLNRIFLSGETASDQEGHLATTNNANLNISTKFSLAILYRYFDKSYHALYSNAFSETSGTQNETGFYSGIIFYPSKNWSLKAYIDFYQFPWLRYQISRPSSGVDYFVLATYTLSRQFDFYIKYQDECKEKDFILENTSLHSKQQKQQRTRHLRIHFNYTDLEHFRFKTRIEWSFYEHTEKQNGILLYQDIIYDWQKIPLRTSFRFSIFDTDGYYARIYAYENDLLYNFSIPGFSDRGIRTYFLIKYELIKNLDLWIKYGITIYSDKNIIGSGYNQIEGNKRSEIKLQLRWKF